MDQQGTTRPKSRHPTQTRTEATQTRAESTATARLGTAWYAHKAGLDRFASVCRAPLSPLDRQARPKPRRTRRRALLLGPTTIPSMPCDGIANPKRWYWWYPVYCVVCVYSCVFACKWVVCVCVECVCVCGRRQLTRVKPPGRTRVTVLAYQQSLIYKSIRWTCLRHSSNGRPN